MKLIDFVNQFPDEQSCREYFREHHQKDGIVCRKCKGTSHYWMKSIGQFQCKTCRTRTTLRSGTVMESSKLSFQDWFRTIQMMTATKKNFSALEVQRQLGRKRYEPVWYMMHKIQVAMSNRDKKYALTGTLELDEGFFESVNSEYKGSPKKPAKRGRGSEKQIPVLVMAETQKVQKPRKNRPAQRYKYFKMKVLESLTADTINGMARRCFNPNSRVKTDNFSSYSRLNEVIKKHTAKTVPPEKAGKGLPRVHISSSNTKRNLLNTYHHVDDVFLQNYLDEFSYKLNRRYFGEKLFDRLLVASLSFSWGA